MTGPRKLCIHGHFYQPPRIDPWLRQVLPEGSAAPGLNWNERILAESYAPLAWSRRKDGQGRITEMVNCYEWISFNCGPTLLSWLESAHPECYARILEADRRSVVRWGHGNAMAQCHHHMIMPLASPLDKEVQLAWSQADFRARFGRDPEGLWLPEAAVDTPTLEAVAAAGFGFVVLAPRQALAVADLDGGNAREVTQEDLDISAPYAVFLPSGLSLAVFFYHGPLSQAVAFERLLKDGEQFWGRLAAAGRPGLTALATDGETYGHHFPFGEMALAYVLEQARRGRDGLELTNFAAFLAENPPARRVILREPSSWSCIHGVERWRSDCGCTDGGHPGWNQRWRAPLRQALEECKARVDEHFFTAGGRCFADPRRALLDYGRLLAGGVAREGFVREHFLPGLKPDLTRQGFSLLAMQEWAMSSLASCAWFFDELSRVEPLNAMAYALRAMELARETGGGDWTGEFVSIMASAVSNIPEKGTGADLWRSHVLPRSMNLGAWAMLGLLLIRTRPGGPEGGGAQAEVRFAGAMATFDMDCASGPARTGRGTLARPGEDFEERFTWRWEEGRPDRHWADVVQVRPQDTGAGGQREIIFSAAELGWSRKQLVVLAWLEQRAEAWWEGQESFARKASELFLKWQKDQWGQNREETWRAHLPGLAWAFVMDELPPAEPGEFLDFLRRHWQPQPLFDARLNRRLLAMLAEEPPDRAALGRIMERIAALGVPLNLWNVENRLWELGFFRPATA